MGRNYADFSGKNNPNYKHGYGRGHPLLVTWQNMKSRCYNPKNSKFHRYGGRGITVDSNWISSNGFISWAESSGYRLGLTIDRIDIDKGYTPENCRWVSKQDNSRRKSTTKLSLEQAVEIRERIAKGECEHELAVEYGVKHGTIWFIQKRVTHVEDGECSRRIKEIKKKNGSLL